MESGRENRYGYLICGGDTSAELSKETKEPDFTEELYWLEQLKAKGIPTILLINKTDIRKDSQALAIKVRESFGDTPVLISAKEKTGIEQIRRTILENSLRISASKVSPER